MCKRKNDFTPNYKTPQQVVKQPVADVQALKQELRIKLWQMIARHNNETLTDPLIKPLENSMPYTSVQSDNTPPADDIADIKPTLDEVLPLPEKDKKEVSEEAPKKPKRKAADLLKPSDAPTETEDKNQITVTEAIAETANVEKADVQTAPANSADKPVSQPQSESGSKAAKENPDQKSKDEKPVEAHKLTRAELRQERLKIKQKQIERHDYFEALELQIHNKNAPCYELLAFIDEL